MNNFPLIVPSTGDLLKYIHKVGNFNAECTRFYSGEIMAALRFLHRVGVVHRDLKPENVLMGENMHIMIADFGSAQVLPLETTTEENPPSPEGDAASPSGRTAAQVCSLFWELELESFQGYPPDWLLRQ